jgi:hypothetical protein
MQKEGEAAPPSLLPGKSASEPGEDVRPGSDGQIADILDIEMLCQEGQGFG